MTTTIAKVAAVLAIIGLIASSFAIGVGAQTTTTSPVTILGLGSFNQNLTIGASGADVTALQNWLIKGGYAIPAGATGYFGAQTQGALARYQAANMISPAVGYFGPITRAKVNAQITVTTDTTDDTDTDDEDDSDDENDDSDTSDREETEESLDDARDSLSDAREEVEEADNGNDREDAEELLDEAEDLIEEAEESFDDKEYDDAQELIQDAEDLIEDALDLVDADDDDAVSNVSTSAEVNYTNGADSDTATFEISFELEAFNQDAYVARDSDVSIDYEIRNGDGEAVGSWTSLSDNLDSTADTSGSYYVIEEGDEETFTFTVVFDPEAADEGEYYRLQLLGVNFNDAAAAPDQDWDARPESKYRTDAVSIPD
jgi:hypothetical protein